MVLIRLSSVMNPRPPLASQQPPQSNPPLLIHASFRTWRSVQFQEVTLATLTTTARNAVFLPDHDTSTQITL